jgi:hypothetical protein
VRRLDPASGLDSLDALAPRQELTEGGLGDEVCEIDGRPVKPLEPVILQRVIAENRARAMRARVRTASTVRPAARRVSAARPRERRYRRTRRTRQASRDGPSDDSGGDGEGPRSSAAAERQHSALTNSQRTTTDCPPWWVGQSGIDTLAFGRRDAAAVAEIRAVSRQQRLDPATGRRQREDWKGRFMRLALPVAGMTIGVYPARGLVIAEARGAAMLAGHSEDAQLIPASKLGAAARRAVAAIESLGVALTAPVTVRRIDLAAELCFLVGAEGLAFLTACERALHLARLDMVPHYATGESRLESIVWQTPKGKATRIKLYDAGPHHKTRKPGERLRLERELLPCAASWPVENSSAVPCSPWRDAAPPGATAS